MPFLTRKQRQKTGFKILLGVLIFFTVYEVYAFASKVYLEYQINLQIQEALEQKEFLIKDNAVKEEKILYYKSDEYKERLAKESLNMHKPGEIVFQIKDSAGNFLTEERAGDLDLDKLPNYEKWMTYFIGTQL